MFNVFILWAESPPGWQKATLFVQCTMCTLSSRHRWASFPKTLLDYDFLRWLGSALNITVRIWVASLPQHWSLSTRIHFGQNIFKFFHFFIFCASDWSQFWYGREKDLTQRDFRLKLDPTQPHIAFASRDPNFSTPKGYKMIQEDQSWFKFGQDAPRWLWETSCT